MCPSTEFNGFARYYAPLASFHQATDLPIIGGMHDDIFVKVLAARIVSRDGAIEGFNDFERAKRRLFCCSYYINADITRACKREAMKKIEFLADSLRRIRDFPNDARRSVGAQLYRLQEGKEPA
ncbi:MAG TPA: hypothetical protein VF920_12660, partial [Dongiaceae bacterium]